MLLDPPTIHPGPREHRVTLEEFERMVAAGVFASDARLELLDGKILEMSPIGPNHAWAVERICDQLRERFRGRAQVFSQNPIRLPGDGEPIPDATLFKFEQEAIRLPEPGDILLVIEVADSSLQDDRGRKLPLYARDGIRECWIRNLLDDQLEVYRDPEGERYATTFTLKDRAAVACQAFPDDLIQWW